MLKFCSLYSGSSGNSSFVETENTKLLIDVGVSSKKVETALNSLNIDPNSLDAILITHEHADHIKGLGTFAKKYNVPVFANQETLDNMHTQTDKISSKNIKTFNISDSFFIGDLKINPFSIPHDAANPCAFNIFKDNTKISIATDIGHMTTQILKNLEGSEFILLESNYSPEMLKYSPYPYHLKQRISSSRGHLSNEDAGKTISCLLDSGLKHAMLGHLSNSNNFPELAYKTVVEELINKNYNENSLLLNVAKRNSPSQVINF